MESSLPTLDYILDPDNLDNNKEEKQINNNNEGENGNSKNNENEIESKIKE